MNVYIVIGLLALIFGCVLWVIFDAWYTEKFTEYTYWYDPDFDMTFRVKKDELKKILKEKWRKPERLLS